MTRKEKKRLEELFGAEITLRRVWLHLQHSGRRGSGGIDAGDVDLRRNLRGSAASAQKGKSETMMAPIWGSMTSEDFCMELGAELNRLRVDKGLSQAELGDKVRVHRNTIKRYEDGQDIPVILFIRICMALEVPCVAVLEKIVARVPAE